MGWGAVLDEDGQVLGGRRGLRQDTAPIRFEVIDSDTCQLENSINPLIQEAFVAEASK